MSGLIVFVVARNGSKAFENETDVEATKHSLTVKKWVLESEMILGTIPAN